MNKVRRCIRSSSYLLDPFDQKIHVSIDGQTTLSDELVNFPTKAIQNTEIYIKSKLDDNPLHITPVFATQADLDNHCSLKNKTIKEIDTFICTLINKLDEQSAKLQTEVFEKTVKNKKKEKYLEFVYKLYDQVEVV